MQGGCILILKIAWHEQMLRGIRQDFRRFTCTAIPLGILPSPNTAN